jgi:hypothetical protein
MSLILPAEIGFTYRPGLSFMLDSVTATAAYGLRRLATAYVANKAIKVRRTSDSATQDIGFLANGRLDTTSLATFCSGTDGYIDTWYDQSGNGLDLASQGSTHDFRIVNAGTIDTLNGVPAGYMVDASRGYMSSTFTTYTGTTLSAACLAALANVTSSGRYLSVFGSSSLNDNVGQTGALVIARNSTNAFWMSNRNGSVLSHTSSGSYGALAQVSATFDGSINIITLNGNSASSVASTAAWSTNRLALGMSSTTIFTTSTGGYLAEAIFKISSGVWSSTDLTNVRNSQKNYAGTP